jgi:hypothetical protein
MRLPLLCLILQTVTASALLLNGSAPWPDLRALRPVAYDRDNVLYRYRYHWAAQGELDAFGYITSHSPPRGRPRRVLLVNDSEHLLQQQRAELKRGRWAAADGKGAIDADRHPHVESSLLLRVRNASEPAPELRASSATTLGHWAGRGWRNAGRDARVDTDVHYYRNRQRRETQLPMNASRSEPASSQSSELHSPNGRVIGRWVEHAETNGAGYGFIDHQARLDENVHHLRVRLL